jgi:dCMP deaminase
MHTELNCFEQVESKIFFLNEKTVCFIHFVFQSSVEMLTFDKNCSMSRPDFDDIYMELAVNLAKRSHCIKKHVGAVLTKDTRIISIGYNGPPAGTHNCDVEFPEHGCARDSKGSCSLALHAEQNAILYAVKNNTSVEGSTLYVTLAPCLACARIIFSMGISKVVYLFSYAEYKGIGSDEGVDFLKKFGVTVDRYAKHLEVVDPLI